MGNRDKTRKRRGNKERIWIARRRAKKEKEILEKKKILSKQKKKRLSVDEGKVANVQRLMEKMWGKGNKDVWREKGFYNERGK